MLVVHTCPKGLIASDHKTDNYFRVRKDSYNYVFPFSSTNPVEARWAGEESRRVLGELGNGAVRSLWKSHPDFRTVELVGAGGQIEDAAKAAIKKNAVRRERATEEAN